MEIYFNSVGRNGLLLLNVPPDTNGRICPEDSLRLIEFRRERDRIFSRDLAAGAEVHAWHKPGHQAKNVLDTNYHTFWAATAKEAELTMELDSLTEFDIIVIQEYIPLGQRVGQFRVEYHDGHRWLSLPTDEQTTTIGYKRILRFPTVQVRRLRLTIIKARATTCLSEIAAYEAR